MQLTSFCTRYSLSIRRILILSAASCNRMSFGIHVPQVFMFLLRVDVSDRAYLKNSLPGFYGVNVNLPYPAVFYLNRARFNRSTIDRFNQIVQGMFDLEKVLALVPYINWKVILFSKNLCGGVDSLAVAGKQCRIDSQSQNSVILPSLSTLSLCPSMFALV